MPAPLDIFLRNYRSGHVALTPEMYQHFGGDELLKSLQQFDPNAKWTDTEIGGGEGGSQGMGKRLDFDVTKMPNSKTPGGKDISWSEIAPSNFGSDGLKNPDFKWDDENYGEVTDSRNIKREVSGIEKYAPLIAAAIAMGGPMAGGLLAGAGIGGGAGFTSAVTGGAAGLGAGSVPGALGAGTFAGSTPGWATNAVKGLPSSMDKIKGGDLTALLPVLIGMSGLDPKLAWALKQAAGAAQGNKPGVGSAISLAQLFGKP
jgi:hypothetical protein